VTDCKVSEETLSAFVDGELSGRQRRWLACHIADCPLCSRRVGHLYAMKSYVAATEKVTSPIPARLWHRVRTALDTVDHVAQSLPRLSPRPAPAWRLPALVTVGILLIGLAIYSRHSLAPGPTPTDLLLDFHRTATAQLQPPQPNWGRYELIKAGSGQSADQLLGSGLIKVGGSFGQQQVYRHGLAAISHFSLPAQSFAPEAMISIDHGGRSFYIASSLELSIVAWRQPDGWRVLVADMYPEQLLPLAQMYADTPDLRLGF